MYLWTLLNCAQGRATAMPPLGAEEGLSLPEQRAGSFSRAFPVASAPTCLLIVIRPIPLVTDKRQARQGRELILILRQTSVASLCPMATWTGENLQLHYSFVVLFGVSVSAVVVL